MNLGVFGTVSIGDRLRSSGGVGHGFDLLRLLLATSVVAWHSNWIVGNDIGDNTPYVWFPGYAILSLFFALSGFLIAGSAARLKLREFLLNRGLRIFPALAMEIVLSAFILGPIFTSLPTKVYLGSGGTWHYLTNIFSIINYHLPGVFHRNPHDEVNISLWTVPFEFLCYAVMSGIIIFRLIYRPKLIVLLAALIILIGIVLQNFFGVKPDASSISMLRNILRQLFVSHQ
jgi:peptidoglycan/LPS O-acetylase OafA/YrhL